MNNEPCQGCEEALMETGQIVGRNAWARIVTCRSQHALEKSEEVLETGIILEIICMFVLYFPVSTSVPA